jgi:hypothetical protein
VVHQNSKTVRPKKIADRLGPASGTRGQGKMPGPGLQDDEFKDADSQEHIETIPKEGKDESGSGDEEEEEEEEESEKWRKESKNHSRRVD